jgi:hypothetical protein
VAGNQESGLVMFWDVERRELPVQLEAILAKFPAAKRNGKGWQAKCPAHEDKKPSLSISAGDDGRTVLHCHAGCSVQAVCEAVGLRLSDLFPDKSKRNSHAGKIVTIYPYDDATGKLLYEVVRFDPKDFRQRRPDKTAIDGYTWNLKGIQRVPYRLRQLIAAIGEGVPIYIAEGEKDCDALNKAGFTATTNAGGAGKWELNFAEYFKGADVCIIADKDKPGWKHAQNVAASLHGVAAIVRVIELPDLNSKPVKDASDFFAAGGQAAEFDEIVQAAPVWKPTSETHEAETPQPPPTKTLNELQRRVDNDSNELLRTAFLCRGGGLLFVGPTGIGKSTASSQAQICFGLGRDFFGIHPARPLRSLVIQAENDEGDMAEMRDGIFYGLELSRSEIETVSKNIIVACEDSRTGRSFADWTVAPLLEKHKPDLVWIDPALAYIGGENASQKDVGFFLRNLLNPLLHKYNCAGVIIHHTNKPPSGKEKPDWQAGDYAYLGSGSAEWANWARAVLALRSIGSHDVFELRAGKRGSRIGWKNADGKREFFRLIGHSKEADKIYWRDASADEIPSKGRPKSVLSNELFELLPEQGLLTAEWKQAAVTQLDISDSTFFREVRSLKDADRIIKSKVSGKWQPVKKQ